MELALLAKRRRVGLRFRYAVDDAVATRMYRTTGAILIEGWTKNLALLFHNALALALLARAGYRSPRRLALARNRPLERPLLASFLPSGWGWVGC